MKKFSLLVVLLVGFVVGCGDSSDSDNPKAAVEGYYAALADSDWEEACNSLTESYQEEIANSLRALKGSSFVPDDYPDLPKESSCQSAAAWVSEADSEMIEEITTAEIVDVKVDDSGKTATVETKFKDQDDGDTLTLEKTDDGWKISDD